MAKRFTRKMLKRMLENTITKVSLLETTNQSLSKSQDKTLLANQRVINDLNLALSLFDQNFKKSCELICNLPYHMVNPNSEINLKKSPIVGSMAMYSRTDTLRHYVRMLPETDFNNAQVWNNVLVLWIILNFRLIIIGTIIAS